MTYTHNTYMHTNPLTYTQSDRFNTYQIPIDVSIPLPFHAWLAWSQTWNNKWHCRRLSSTINDNRYFSSTGAHIWAKNQVSTLGFLIFNLFFLSKYWNNFLYCRWTIYLPFCKSPLMRHIGGWKWSSQEEKGRGGEISSLVKSFSRHRSLHFCHCSQPGRVPHCSPPSDHLSSLSSPWWFFEGAWDSMFKPLTMCVRV